MRTRWPKDHSELSQKVIDLYFDRDEPSFPFPYWIEVGDTQNVYKIRVINSGIIKDSPIKSFLKRPIEVSNISINQEEGIFISLKNISSDQRVQLFATTEHNGCKESVLLPHTVISKKTHCQVHADKKSLDTHLRKHQQYQLTILPLDEPAEAVEVNQSFLWN